MPIGDRTVEIACHGGKFTYSEPEAHLIPGKKLTWKNTHPDCWVTIHIGWNSPLNECSYRLKPGESKDIDVPMQAQIGEYKYLVAYCDGTKIWMDDPRFIIRP